MIVTGLTLFIAGIALGVLGLYMWFFLIDPDVHLINNMDDGVILLDKQDKIKHINPRLETFLKVSTAEYKGKSVEALLEGYRYQEVELPDTNKKRREIRHLGRTLEIKESEIHDRFGMMYGRLMIFHDVTQHSITEMTLGNRLDKLLMLRRVYDELTGTLDIQSVVMFGVDSAMRLSGANAGYIAIEDENGIIRVTEHIGSYSNDTINNLLQSKQSYLDNVIQNGKPELIRDVSLVENFVPLIASTKAQMIIPLITSNGNLIGILNLDTSHPDRFTSDTFQFIQILGNRITAAIENARLYKQVKSQLVELRQTYEQIRELEQLKTDMIRIAAHDLGSPINAIKLAIDFLERANIQLEPVVQRNLVRIKESTDRMQHIVGDILSLERIESAADQDNNVEKVDLLKHVQRAVREYEPLAEEKAQHLRMVVNETDEFQLDGQSTQLYEAVTNLISNAIKYTPNGGKIEVQLSNEADRIAFRVIDTGFGIPPDKQDRLFQPFYRVKTRETDHLPGTGLGLHLVKNIVERHNGEIIFYSAYGEGSTFGFSLARDTDQS